MKDVLMVVHTMGNLLPSDNDRFTYLANMLLNNGAEVEIVTSDFEHHKKKYREKNILDLHPFKITLLHENYYKKNISLSRIKGHVSFAIRLKRYLMRRKRPDVIYCAVPPTISAAVTAQYAIRYNVPFVIDIQDLWPEAFVIALGNNMFSRFFLKPLEILANYTYGAANAIVAVSNTYVKRAQLSNRKAKTFESVYLGTDGDIVRPLLNAKISGTKSESEFVIGYVGNFGKSYDFIHLFQALSILKSKGINDIRLVLIGDGNERYMIEKLANQYFKNTRITGYLPYEEMLRELALCDIAINPIVKESVSTVVNKVGDYAAAGKAVINTQSSSEYRELVVRYNIGFNTISENAQDIADKILLLYRDRPLCARMGENNKKVFYKYFDRGKTYRKIIDSILKEEFQ